VISRKDGPAYVLNRNNILRRLAIVSADATRQLALVIAFAQLLQSSIVPVAAGGETMSASEAIRQYSVLDTAPETGFEDIVALAALICEAPTVLVSLLDTDRQWFKARMNFESEQTGLDQSVCRHVIEEGVTVVIPDLTADARTRDNPLVTGVPHIRFYAGAPLATRFGIVGALCVIDTSPRPDGLSPGQQLALERLARQVVTLLEMRRDAADLQRAIAERDASEAAQKMTERRWRDLYQGMDQGFIYARAVRTADGDICD